MSPAPTAPSYLAHLRANAGRLSDLAAEHDLDVPVPTCPGWSLHDLVGHCGEVYAHKRSALRLGRAPEPGEVEEPPEGEAVVAFHDEQVAALADELERLGPDAPAWTWYPGQATTAFWFRRMAHESLVHRIDGELATTGVVGPVEPELAADGVGEVLWFAGHPGVLAHSVAQSGASGTVLVDAGIRSYAVELRDGGHLVHEVSSLNPVDAAGAASADAVVRGEAADLDLVLWGRPADGEVEESGDLPVLERLFSRLHLAVAD